MELNLKYGEVFKQTTKALDSGFDVVIHKGGTGSGKTYELMLMLLFSRAMIVPNEIITIVSESHPHLKIGTIRYLDKFISDYNLHHVIKVNQSDKNILISKRYDNRVFLCR